MKKEKVIDILGKLMECAKKAGIYQNTFLGYGTLLGKVRENRPIKHDPDADVCILADKCTQEQEQEYYLQCQKMGLFKARPNRIRKRGDNGRFLWFSVKEYKQGCKCCNWFQQRWNGYYWHSKAHTWVWKIGGHLKPPVGEAVAIMKGVKEDLFDGGLTEVDYCGIKINIPKRYGTLLDIWYPNWAIPKKGGASDESRLLIVKQWENEKTWSIRKR